MVLGLSRKLTDHKLETEVVLPFPVQILDLRVVDFLQLVHLQGAEVDWRMH